MSFELPRLNVIWKFSRPHAFIGTAASIFSLWLIAAAGNNISLHSIIGLLSSFVVCLSAAFFIVGINQYFDVAIDEINKPFLPMASKELSPIQASCLLGGCAAIAWVGMLFFNRYLIGTVVASSVLGIAYSAPPLRLKHNALFAAVLIILVRGPIINLGLFGHFKSLNSSNAISGFPNIVWLLCILSSLIAVCIAVCKDIPDVSGDKKFGQSTFAQKFGQQTMLNFVVLLLGVSLLAAAVAFYFVFSSWIAVAMIVFQLAVLFFLAAKGLRTDATRKDRITNFYMTIWNAFLLEYIVIAIAYFAQTQLTTTSSG